MKTDNVIFLKKNDKICPICNTVNKGKNIFYCIKCNTWIPHLNTSWVRSATNLFLIKRILEVVAEKTTAPFLRKDLLNALIERKIIKIDKTREKDKKYWAGSPARRASEYIQIFKYLGIIEPYSDNKFSITEIGKEIINCDKRIDFIDLFVLVLTHFDPSNKYVEKRYSNIRCNYFLLALDLIDQLEKNSLKASVEHVGLAFLCRDENDYLNAKKIGLKYSKKELIETIWGDSRELSRVIKSVFLRWLEQSKLVYIDRDPRNFKIKITKFGKKILEKYKNNKFKVKESSLFKKALLGEISDYIKKETKNISEILISSTKTEDRFKLTLGIKKTITQRFGGAWEQYVFNHLLNLGLEPRWYKETQDFANIKLPNSVINALTGGTRYNPDIIFYKPLFLIDPKDDANKEMYKVQAYDGYATHSQVNANALIVSKELMGKDQAERMADLKRTFVIDKEALDLLVNNKSYLNRDLIVKILGYGCSFGEYLNEEVILEKIDTLA